VTPRKRTYGRGALIRFKKRGVEYGCYLMRYFVGGKRVVESTRTTDLMAATRMLNERLGDVATGQAPAPGLSRITCGDLLDDLIVQQEVEQAPSVRTTRTHKVALEQIPPGIAGIRAADLTTKHLQRFVTACRKAGHRCDGKPGHYAEASIGRFLDTLKSALNLGRKTSPPKVLSVPLFPEIDESGNVRTGFATVAQANVIFDQLAAFEQDLADAVEWKFWTGMRKGAIARLGWDLWDLETEMLRLPPAGRKKRTPKAVPLKKGHPLRAILDRRWDRRKERARETGKLEPLIFWRVYKGAPKPATNGRPGLRQGDAVPVYEYRKPWKKAAAAAGCPKLTPHDFRRTAIRNSWQATHDRRTGMLLSGHVTESTYERYNIDSGEQLVGHLDQIADYVQGQPQGARPEVPSIPRRRRRGRS
jgi:integrase